MNRRKISVALIFVVFIFLAALVWFYFSTQEYSIRVTFNDINDITVGSPLKYKGMKIGSVSEIKIRPDNKITLTLTVDDSYTKFIRKKALFAVSRDFFSAKAPEILLGYCKDDEFENLAMLESGTEIMGEESQYLYKDPEINKNKAARAIARFVSLHPHNLAQKTEIIIEHFKQVVAAKIGGRAKAMAVTASRLHAKRYFEEFKRYIKNKGYEQDIKILVAFSGRVFDDNFPDGVTEPELTGFGEKELPGVFEQDEYKILIVDEWQIYLTSEIDALAKVYFNPATQMTATRSLNRMMKRKNSKRA